MATQELSPYKGPKGKRAVYTPAEKKQNAPEVQKLALAGYDDGTIARMCDLSEDALRRHHRFDLDFGREKANGEVGNTLYRMATSGDYPSVAIFWAKTRMGWRETDRHEITGANGGPIDLRALTDSQLAQIAAGDDPPEADPELPEGDDGDSDADADAEA